MKRIRDVGELDTVKSEMVHCWHTENLDGFDVALFREPNGNHFVKYPRNQYFRLTPSEVIAWRLLEGKPLDSLPLWDKGQVYSGFSPREAKQVTPCL